MTVFMEIDVFQSHDGLAFCYQLIEYPGHSRFLIRRHKVKRCFAYDLLLGIPKYFFTSWTDIGVYSIRICFPYYITGSLDKFLEPFFAPPQLFPVLFMI